MAQTPLSLAQIKASARRVGHRLHAVGFRLATAESCTGGLVASALTAFAGASAWFDRGFVTYSIASKIEILGVSAALIEQHNVVSEPVACAMAEGALLRSNAQIALSITGLAGPGGNASSIPVGTVCFAWSNGATTMCETYRFEGARQQVMKCAAQQALQGVSKFINLYT
jgi:nicotinamide-nucleotide amidase